MRSEFKELDEELVRLGFKSVTVWYWKYLDDDISIVVSRRRDGTGYGLRVRTSPGGYKYDARYTDISSKEDLMGLVRRVLAFKEV